MLPKVLCTSWEGLKAAWFSRLRQERRRSCPGRCQLKPGLVRFKNSPFVRLCLPGAWAGAAGWF